MVDVVVNRKNLMAILNEVQFSDILQVWPRSEIRSEF